MKIGIKKKIVIMNISVLIPVIFLISIVTIYNLHTKIIKNSIDVLKKESYNSQAFIMDILKNEDDSSIDLFLKNMSPFIATYLSDNSKTRVQLYNPSYKIGDSNNYPDIKKDDDVTKALQGNKAYIIRKFENKSYVLFSSPIYYKNRSIGCIRYVYKLDKENNILINTILSMTCFGILGILISIIFSNLFSKKIVNPIVTLKTAAEQVSKGDFSKEICINSEDEIEDLSNSFNIMSKNINKMILKLKDEKENQKRFLDNVTHEFKTPLTSIIGYSDLLLRVKSKEHIKQCANYIQKSGERLLNLVEDLLNLSKLNKNELEIKKSPVDIKEILEYSIELLRPRIQKFGINVETNLISKVINIDKDKTEQVILNILDNAIKYSECTEISVIMKSENKSLKIFIIDNGRGIPKCDLKKVFEPFYTAHKNLQKQRGGNGLGLTICKEIMEKQNGKINIESIKGTKVILIFNL